MGASEHWVSESATLTRHPALQDQVAADLAASLDFFVRTYLHEHGLPTDGLSVEAEVSEPSHPGVDGDLLSVRITLPVERSVAG